ncbi:bromodomain-containing protein 7 [Cylas formicarius]|uniref:bromodomain-containing protein 7 n=1 Tax=Cylas formicarius TaxID=197179 RepID=UPI002958D57A|nr:bromodomain-containing protein 7 [Cylas formicarius]
MNVSEASVEPPAHTVCPKKHKKHKKDRDDKPGLKLILKVGSNNTPEHEEEYLQLEGGEGAEQMVLDPNDPAYPLYKSHHKKSKKKKKKKDKSKDREKKHKHHHKDKKRKREDVDEENEISVTYVDIKPTPVYSEEVPPYSQIGSPGSHREQRTCVVKKMQERTPLSKVLDHLLGMLEKKDPQNFFAWPVTDNIAPGYSRIISQPMDFSTMRQKIEDNEYGTLKEFTDDFQLMCNNAMKYNHVDTVYYKASRKLLQAGMKILQPEKLGWLVQLAPELTDQEVGFEITPEMRAAAPHHRMPHDGDDEDAFECKVKKMPTGKFEAIPDDLTPEEILAQAKSAARIARARLRGPATPMGFLRQRRDGTTHLNILVGGAGGKKKPIVPLGQLVGRLTEGTAQLQGFREDRRNAARPVKPLYYGAFGSYAPSHDSAFSNLTKDESALVLRTYGSDQAVQYAESVQDFVRGSDYAERLVDSLLDLLTGGDHSRTKGALEDGRRLKDEEEAVRTVLETAPVDSVKVSMEDLRSLQDVGIDVNFLESMEEDIRIDEERHEMQQKLNDMCQLLEKLQKTQYERLSQPMSLHQVAQPTAEEAQLADQTVDGLAELAKRAAPGAVVSVPGIRRALGVDVPPPEPLPDLETELRQFLEREPAPLVPDKTIEEILMD